MRINQSFKPSISSNYSKRRRNTIKLRPCIDWIHGIWMEGGFHHSKVNFISINRKPLYIMRMPKHLLTWDWELQMKSLFSLWKGNVWGELASPRRSHFSSTLSHQWSWSLERVLVSSGNIEKAVYESQSYHTSELEMLFKISRFIIARKDFQFVIPQKTTEA